ncbi:MAG: carbon storage regulator [Polyangiaceae bacterium]|nr:carbon storage regulator [Polyangiaceae bacterium]
MLRPDDELAHTAPPEGPRARIAVRAFPVVARIAQRDIVVASLAARDLHLHGQMFIVARRKGQRIMIGPDIEVVVTELSRSTVKLGVKAPKPCQILRGELYDSIEQANREALTTGLENPAEAFNPVRVSADLSPRSDGSRGHVNPLALAGVNSRTPDGSSSEPEPQPTEHVRPSNGCAPGQAPPLWDKRL